MSKFDMGRFAEVLGNVPDSGTETGLKLIPIERIFPNKWNFYPRVEDFEGLKESLLANGLLEPLTVVPGYDEGTYRLISGENRFRASRDLYDIYPDDQRWKALTCLVLPPMSEAQERSAIIESNRQRKKSGSLIQEEAEKLTQSYIERKKAGEELPGRIRDRVAEALQVSKTKLATLKVIKEKLVVPGFIEKWKAGEIPEAVAYEIAKMPHLQQYSFLDYTIEYSRTPSINNVKQFNTIYTCCKHDCPHTGGLCPNCNRMYEDRYRGGEWHCAGCCESCLHKDTCKTACKFIPKPEPEPVKETPKNPAVGDPRLDWRTMGAKFGQRLTELRKATGMERKEFAESIGHFQGTYSAWENGQLPGSDRMPLLALAFGVTTDYLFGLTDESTPTIAAPEPEGQMVITGWMPGGTTPATPCDVVADFDMGGTKALRRCCRWDGKQFLFDKGGISIELPPIRWMMLPEVEEKADDE